MSTSFFPKGGHVRDDGSRYPEHSAFFTPASLTSAPGTELPYTRSKNRKKSACFDTGAALSSSTAICF